MYGRAIRFAINKHVQQSTINLRVYPSNFYSSVSNSEPNHKNRNLIDDIRESASGLPSVSSSGGGDDRLNVVKTSTTPSFSNSDREQGGGDKGSSSADTAKQGFVKAVETGLEIGEMAKKTLDSVWDATKDTTHQVKEAVAGDEKEKNDVPPTDRFVDDLRKRAEGYDLRER